MTNCLRIVNVVSIFFLVILVGCNKDTPSPEEVSNSIILTYQTGPAIHIYGNVDSTLDNPTNQCIVFPTDYNLKIYKDSTIETTEIKNTTAYIGARPYYLRPVGEIESTLFVTFSPDLTGSTISEPTSFYAEITGHLCNDESVIIKKRIPFIVIP